MREFKKNGENFSRIVINIILIESEFVNFDFSFSQLDRALKIINKI